VVERIFGASSSTLVIQDGKDAGQSVDHVHLHVMPRRPGDFAQNDEVIRVDISYSCVDVDTDLLGD